MKKKISTLLNSYFTPRNSEMLQLYGYDCERNFISEKVKFPWYFYMKRSEMSKINGLDECDIFKRLLRVEKIEERDDIRRIYCNYRKFNARKYDTKVNRDIYSVFSRNGIQTLEADIDPVKRYILDSDIALVPNKEDVDIFYYDIETDDRVHGLEIGKSAILSIAIKGIKANGDIERRFLSLKDMSEKELLIEFFDVSRKYSVRVGYNNYYFDDKYTLKRFEMFFKNNDSDFYWDNFFWFAKGMVSIDFYQRIKSAFKYSKGLYRFSLDYVSNYFLGERKVQFDKGGSYETFVNNYDTFVRRNKSDVNLLIALEEKLGIIDGMFQLSSMSKCLMSQFWTNEIMDCWLVSLSNEKGIKQPTNIKKSRMGELKIYEPKVSYAGGYVFDIKPGVYKNVCVLDFKSLYPTLILSFNIGTNNILDSEQKGCIKSPVNGVFISKDVPGDLFLGMDKILSLRNKFKEEKNNMIQNGVVDEKSVEFQIVKSREMSIKELQNSMYGMTGFPYSRFYNLKIAETITLGGHFVIKATEEYFRLNGYNCIGGDTDSVFVYGFKSVDGVKNVLGDLNVYIQDRFIEKFRVENCHVEIDVDKWFSSFIYVAKKNYAGYLSYKDEQYLDVFEVTDAHREIKGLEAIKGDTLEITRGYQLNFLRCILLNGWTVDRSAAKVKSIYDRYFSSDLSLKDIVIYKRITKNPDEYKTKPQHVLAVEKKWGLGKDFYVGCEIGYVVEDFKEKIYTHEDDFKGIYDKGYYWDHRIYPPIKRVLSIAYKDFDWDQFDHKKKRSKKSKESKCQ